MAFPYSQGNVYCVISITSKASGAAVVLLSGGLKAVMPRDIVALHGDKVQPGAQVAISNEPNWTLPVVQAVVELSPQLELDTATQHSDYRRRQDAQEVFEVYLKKLAKDAASVVEISIALAAGWTRYKELGF